MYYIDFMVEGGKSNTGSSNKIWKIFLKNKEKTDHNHVNILVSFFLIFLPRRGVFTLIYSPLMNSLKKYQAQGYSNEQNRPSPKITCVHGSSMLMGGRGWTNNSLFKRQKQRIWTTEGNATGQGSRVGGLEAQSFYTGCSGQPRYRRSTSKSHKCLRNGGF